MYNNTHKEKVKMGTQFRHKGWYYTQIRGTRNNAFSYLWRMEKFWPSKRYRALQNTKWIILFTLNWKVFVQTNPMQPRLGRKQKTGREFLQLVSVIKVSFLNYRENQVKFIRIQVIPQLINGQKIWTGSFQSKKLKLSIVIWKNALNHHWLERCKSKQL